MNKGKHAKRIASIYEEQQRFNDGSYHRGLSVLGCDRLKASAEAYIDGERTQALAKDRKQLEQIKQKEKDAHEGLERFGDLEHCIELEVSRNYPEQVEEQARATALVEELLLSVESASAAYNQETGRLSKLKRIFKQEVPDERNWFDRNENVTFGILVVVEVPISMWLMKQMGLTYLESFPCALIISLMLGISGFHTARTLINNSQDEIEL